MESAVFKIVGMGCSCEGSIVEKRMKKLRGVESFLLNPFTDQLRVSFDPDAVTMSDIQKTVEKAGVKAVLMGDSAADARRKPETPARHRSVLSSAAACAGGPHRARPWVQ